MVWLPLATVVVSQLMDQPSEPSSSTPNSVLPRRNVTRPTSTSSEASAVMSTMPETEAPCVGDVIVTDGGSSIGLSTVTTTESDAVWLLPSEATAVIVWVPLGTVVVSQDTDQPSDPFWSVPTVVVPTRNT